MCKKEPGTIIIHPNKPIWNPNQPSSKENILINSQYMLHWQGYTWLSMKELSCGRFLPSNWESTRISNSNSGSCVYDNNASVSFDVSNMYTCNDITAIPHSDRSRRRQFRLKCNEWTMSGCKSTQELGEAGSCLAGTLNRNWIELNCLYKQIFFNHVCTYFEAIFVLNMPHNHFSLSLLVDSDLKHTIVSQ